MRPLRDRGRLKTMKVLLIFIALIITACSGDKSMDVTMENVEDFKFNLTSALPIGMPRIQVETHLNELGIPNAYADRNKTIYARIHRIGRYKVMYVTHLLIQIKFDVKDSVQSIEYDFEHIGP